MNLLCITRYQFEKRDGKTYALPAYGNRFWEKYMDVFETINVFGENIKGYLNNGTLSEITNPNISVELLPSNVLPQEFVNDRIIKAELEKNIKAADAILIKPSSRKGIMAIKIAEKYNKPYMIEMTGDLTLTLKNNPNLLKRIYNPFLHRQTLKAIKKCKFGLYVTQNHLQRVYPIAGIQCGCTDTILPYIDETALIRRLKKIEAMQDNNEINIGMVASYHDSRKGLDTAIKALSVIKNKRVVLHVLGLGTQEDREKWYAYAERYGVKHRLIFDAPCSNVEDVLLWNDVVDVCILPSRSEGLPRCIVESISRACPNIVSNVCGMPELVGEEWVHEPENYKQLAQLIDLMISDKEIMKKVAITNFNHSKNYEFGKLKDKRNGFFEEFKKYCLECRKI